MIHKPDSHVGLQRHDSLVAAFESSSLPADAFPHHEHVRLTWAIRASPLPVAIERVTSGLRKLTQALGAKQKYHETITWFLILLIHERMGAVEPAEEWDAFATRNRDLLESSREVLRRYYRDETLQSARAKATFVLPDRSAAPPADELTP